MPTQIETWNPTSLEPIEYPSQAFTEAVILGPSLTLVKGTVLGKITSSKKHAAYNDALTNGVEVATCILKYDVVTDANGKVYIGTSATPSALNLPHETAVVYVSGVFDTTELTGYDAAAKADLHGRLLPSGYLSIPL